jgi:DNA helicase-2/ATP-dependent DNA helicase PcrA
MPLRYVFVDEVQDMCPLDHALLQTVILQNSGCNLFAVGDPRQSIYQFRGASVSSMSDIQYLFRATIHESNVSHRCSHRIAAVVRQIEPKFAAAPTAMEGAVA